MFETTITLTRQSIAALPIGVLRPGRDQTRSRLFTIAETDPEPKVITPPGWHIHGRARRDGNLIYAISPDWQHNDSAMPSNQRLIRKYAEFFEHDQGKAWLSMPLVDSESLARFTGWLAARMTDDISGIPSLTDFEKDALPALRAAWQDARDAVANAVRMPQPQDPPVADFLLQIVEPDTAQVAIAWPLTDRARQYVSRQNQTFPDRLITAQHPFLHRVLEQEGYRVSAAP